MLIDICIVLFIIMESANIVALYFQPDTKQFNGMGVFKAWLTLKDDEQYGDVARYLVNWVAGASSFLLPC